MTTAVGQEAVGPEWGSFVSSVWEQRPSQLKCDLVNELPSADELFDATVAAAEAAKDGRLDDPGDVRLFFNDGVITPGFVHRYLPERKDRGFDNYAERLTQMGGSSYALTINSLQQFSWSLFDTARRHMSALHRALGWLPAGGTDCHLIMGRYKEAPTRVHKDTAGVFTFVVQGAKRFYLWPFERFSDLAGPGAMYRQVNLGVDYSDYLDEALIVEGRPGDVFYWPASYWHCGESDDANHVTLHIANYLYRDPTASAGRLLKKVVSELSGDDVWMDGVSMPDINTTILPAAFSAALDRFADTTVHNEVRDRLRATWLRRLTGGNFEVVPTPVMRRTPATSTDRVVRVPDAEWMLHQASSSTAELSINGQALRLPWRHWLVPLSNVLTEGGAYAVEDLMALFRKRGCDVVVDEVLSVVNEFIRCGALILCAAGANPHD